MSNFNLFNYRIMNVRYYYLVLVAFLLFACQDEERFIGKDSKIDFSYTINQETQTVFFTNTSTENFNDFQWLFGDSSSSNSKNPTHTYQKEGTYSVTLKAYNTYAKGYQLISKDVEIKKTNPTTLRVQFQPATNVDYAGFDLNWSIQNRPNGATFKLLLSTSETFSSNLQTISVEPNETSHIFTNLKPNQTYYYKALIDYVENTVSHSYESDIQQVTLTNFFITSSSMTLQRNADDLDVMYFRVVINEYLSSHVVDIENTNLPYSEKVVVTVDGEEVINPVEGLAHTYLKRPNTLFTVNLEVMYRDSTDQISEGLIIEDSFLVKRQNNTLWKGSTTQKQLNNNYTELVLGNSNGEKLVFQLTNYSEQEGQEYILVMGSSLNSTAYYMDGINNDKYYLQSENLILKCTHLSNNIVYYSVLDQSNQSIDMLFQQDPSLTTPQSVRFEAVSFIIK